MGRPKGSRNKSRNEHTICHRAQTLAKQLHRSPSTLLAIRYGRLQGAPEVRQAMREAGLLHEHERNEFPGVHRA